MDLEKNIKPDYRLNGHWCRKSQHINTNMIGQYYDRMQNRLSGPNMDLKAKQINDLKNTKNDIVNALKLRSKIKQQDAQYATAIQRNHTNTILKEPEESIATPQNEEDVLLALEAPKCEDVIHEQKDNHTVHEPIIQSETRVDTIDSIIGSQSHAPLTPQNQDQTARTASSDSSMLIAENTVKANEEPSIADDKVIEWIDDIVGADLVNDKDTNKEDDSTKDAISGFEQEVPNNTPNPDEDTHQIHDIQWDTNHTNNPKKNDDVQELRNSMTELRLTLHIKDEEIKALEARNLNLTTNHIKHIDSVPSSDESSLSNHDSETDEENDEKEHTTDHDDDTSSSEDSDSSSDESTDSDTSEHNSESEHGFFDYVVSYFASDKEKDGKIQITEGTLQQIFNKIDVDQSELIDFNEFQKCGELLGLSSKKMDYRKEFDRVDVDKSGYLDYAEFRCAVLGKKAKRLSVKELKVMVDEMKGVRSDTLDVKAFVVLCEKIGFGALTEEDEDDLKTYFDDVDVENRGRIDFKGLVEAILGTIIDDKEVKKVDRYSKRIRNIKNVFTKMDKDESGSLSVNEFMVSAKVMKCPQNEERLQELFGAYDLDSDGRIDRREFIDLMYKLITNHIKTKVNLRLKVLKMKGTLACFLCCLGKINVHVVFTCSLFLRMKISEDHKY
eukprot:803460_1